MPSPGETLVPVRQRASRWVEFDAHWYRKTYSIGASVKDPLADYLNEGQRLARSPNVFFDEAFYLRRYPDVARAVQEGGYRSGFDHYCRDGLLTYSPHWLFDPEFYRLQLPGAEACGTHANDYDHFLCVGCGLGLTGHPLFDPEFYRIAAGRRQMPVRTAAGAYAHFVYQIHQQRSASEASLYFDSAWYRRNYPS